MPDNSGRSMLMPEEAMHMAVAAAVHLHYRFWDEISFGFQWVFERLGPTVVSGKVY